MTFLLNGLIWHYVSFDTCQYSEVINIMADVMADPNSLQKKEETKKKQKRYPNKNYALKKRLPPRPVNGDNVLFITKKTNFKVKPKNIKTSHYTM